MASKLDHKGSNRSTPDGPIRLIGSTPAKPQQTRSQRFQQRVAEALQRHRPKPFTQETNGPNVTTGKTTFVCISDTHNDKLDLPAGDILIHAGDLSQEGSVLEIQEQLDWLDSLEGYLYKIVIAGNHDRSLQPPDQSPIAGSAAGQEAPVKKTSGNYLEPGLFNLGSLLYLCDRAIAIYVRDRLFIIHGTPWTPEYGNWQFTYPRNKDDSFWLGKIPHRVNVLVAHGPPKGYLDTARDGRHVGSLGLLKELQRVRPRLFVCGHVHDARGRSDVVLDRISSKTCAVVNALGGGGGPTLMGKSYDAGEGGSWLYVFELIVLWLYEWVKALVTRKRDDKVTIMVNAACAPPARDEELRDAIVVEL